LAESTAKYFVDKWKLKAIKSKTVQRLENEYINGIKWETQSKFDKKAEKIHNKLQKERIDEFRLAAKKITIKYIKNI
jgi:hypothetical protein